MGTVSLVSELVMLDALAAPVQLATAHAVRSRSDPILNSGLD